MGETAVPTSSGSALMADANNPLDKFTGASGPLTGTTGGDLVIGILEQCNKGLEDYQA